jgi:hypothetical protein
MSAEVP